VTVTMGGKAVTFPKDTVALTRLRVEF
jgi:hypothetical protein